MNLSLRTRALSLLTALLVMLGASACQTTNGFGKDVEKLGDKIQDSSH